MTPPLLTHRNDFVRLIDALGCRSGAELGVGAGSFSRVLLGSHLERLWMVDHWADPINRPYREQALSVAAESGGRAVVAEEDCLDWLRRQPDDSVDFIYLDTAHAYKPASEQIPECWRVARRVLAGHDYATWNPIANAEVGIVVAVEELAERFGLTVHVTGCPTTRVSNRLRAALDGAILADPGLWGCDIPSFWCVKPSGSHDPPLGDPFGFFLSILARYEKPDCLEIGTRRVIEDQPTVRRDRVPHAGTYLGIDMREGLDVDVVCDAHVLSRHFAPKSFDAVICCSTFEHIARPWIAAEEIAKVLRPGGLVYVQTHQTYPLHDSPEDFWRFSARGLEMLFGPPNFDVVLSGHEFPCGIESLRVPHLKHQPAFLNSVILSRRTQN